MEPHDLIQQLQSAAGGNHQVLGELLEPYRDRLRHMVRFRIDYRVRRRVDPSDVIQETFFEASRRLNDYLRDPSVPFLVWLRYLATQRLRIIHRHHLGIQARAADRELPQRNAVRDDKTSFALASHLVGHLPTPSSAAVRKELKLLLRDALDGMDPIDREVLALRHYEQLSNIETSHVLGIRPTAACNRYVRALERLRQILSQMPGGLSHWRI